MLIKLSICTKLPPWWLHGRGFIWYRNSTACSNVWHVIDTPFGRAHMHVFLIKIFMNMLVTFIERWQLGLLLEIVQPGLSTFGNKALTNRPLVKSSHVSRTFHQPVFLPTRRRYTHPTKMKQGQIQLMSCLAFLHNLFFNHLSLLSTVWRQFTFEIRGFCFFFLSTPLLPNFHTYMLKAGRNSIFP